MNEGAHVLNLRLPPLQVGHLFLLDSVESSFVTGSEFSFADLITSVFICARPWRRSSRALNSRFLSWQCRLWGWSCRKGFIPEHEGAKLRRHIKDSLDVPRLKYKASPHARQSGVPVHVRLYKFLQSEMGRSEPEAKDELVRDAVNLWAVSAEEKGAAEFYTDFEMDVFEECRNRDLELVASGVLNPDGTRRKK